MKILFDECVPTDLRTLLHGHKITTVTEHGWKGVKNGELLKLAASEFDLFLTVDKNLSFQQNPKLLPLPIIVVHCHSNKARHLAPLMPKVLAILEGALEKQVYHVGA